MTPWGIDSAEKKKAKLNLGLDDGVFVRMALGLEKLIVTCLFFFFFFLRVVFVRSTQARHLKVRDHRGIFSCMERDSAMIQSRRRPEMSVLRLRSRAPFPSLPRQAHRRAPPPSHTDSTQQRKATRLSPNSPTPSFHPPRDDQRAKPPQPVKEIRKPGKRDRVRG